MDTEAEENVFQKRRRKQMKLKSRSQKVLLAFIILFLISGIVLLYKGFDPVAQAKVRKDGILTAEQVKVSFDSVGGRLIKEAVKEGDHVEEGDILMVLDATDINLSIEKTEAQIAQLDAQIAAQAKSIDIGFAQADTSEVQTFRQIDMQKAAIASANSTYETKLADFHRMETLAESGAISQKELDAYRNNMEVAKANAVSAVNGLNQLLGGANDTGNTDNLVLPTIQNQRAEVDNQKNTLQGLQQQKKQLEVALKELKVNHGRLVLRAPENGKILKVIAKEGEMVSPNTPVILLESERLYYDIYVPENDLGSLKEGNVIEGRTIAGNIKVPGTVRLIARADGFADYKMSREKSSADITSFQVRIYTKPVAEVIPGMTIEVHHDQFTKK